MSSESLPSNSERVRPTPYIERDGRFWQVVFPADPDDGMDLCTGPHLTRLGARLSLRFSTWLNGRATHADRP